MTENNDVSNEEKITRDLVADLKSQISRLSSMKEKGFLAEENEGVVGAGERWIGEVNRRNDN